MAEAIVDIRFHPGVAAGAYQRTREQPDRQVAIPYRTASGGEAKAVVFDNVNMEEAVSEVMKMAWQTDRPRHVCTANLDHMAMIQNDEAFRSAYEEADLVLADGMPIVWLSRIGGSTRLQERVAGSDLFWELARKSAETGVQLFFLGGAPGSANAAAEAAKARYPEAKICGIYCPSFEEFGTEAEEARIAAAIREAKPDILMVGLGAPKQEKWIMAHKDQLGVPVSIGVGGSFEMACGMLRRAPQWMQNSGMEWSYRLMQEPGRLWRRYIMRDLPVLIRLAHHALATAHI